MKVLQSIANSVHQSVRMTIDYPSKHQDGKVPMLDVKKWIQEVNGRWLTVYEHYEKEMATKAVIHATSAIPKATKRGRMSADGILAVRQEISQHGRSVVKILAPPC